jgi:putative ABC transport system permease protein
MVGMDLGFNKDRVLVIRRPDALEDQIETFKSEIMEHPQIESVTNSNSIPGRHFMAANFMVEGDSSRHNVFLHRIFVSHEFFETYGIDLIEGRFFTSDPKEDLQKCILNETAAKELGIDSIIGTILEAPRMKNAEEDRLEIIGIIRDFNFESVDKPIDPLIITLMPGNWEGYLNVRLSGWGTEKTISYIENTWKKYTTEYPFLYFFLDDDFNRNYVSFVRTGKILLIFALLSIFVACLGLFGLVLFTSNQRTREIGIRKSLGATHYKIIFMLLKETFFLVLYSSVLAWISGYILARLWLRDFSTHISLVPKYFILSTLIVMVLSMIVVLYQALSASRSNPATAL